MKGVCANGKFRSWFAYKCLLFSKQINFTTCTKVSKINENVRRQKKLQSSLSYIISVPNSYKITVITAALYFSESFILLHTLTVNMAKVNFILATTVVPYWDNKFLYHNENNNRHFFLMSIILG